MISAREINLEKDSDWNTLLQKSNTASFFQTPEWLKLWVKHFVKKEEVKILEVRKNKVVIGIVPLLSSDFLTPGVRCRRNTTPGVSRDYQLLGITPVLGGELVSDFGDIIASKGREKEVWETIINNFQFSIFNFQFIREDSSSFEVLKRMGGEVKEEDVAPYIDLPSTWEEYLASLDRHDRHELRRKIRRLEEKKTFKICYQGNPADIEEFFRLMELSSDQKRGFLKPEMKQFFRDIYSEFWSKNMLELCFLNIEGKNIAGSVTFFFKDEVLLYNSGFNPDYSKLSPGLVLKAYLIKHAIENSKKRFDFLRGGERYKYDLGAVERKLYKFSFKNPKFKIPAWPAGRQNPKQTQMTQINKTQVF